MIVITQLNRRKRHLSPGDTFSVTYRDVNTGQEDKFVEEITITAVIDFMCVFRFAEEDGTVIGFHLSGFFGNSKNLPKEMQEAVHIDDLTTQQRANFDRSYGAIIRSM